MGHHFLLGEVTLQIIHFVVSAPSVNTVQKLLAHNVLKHCLEVESDWFHKLSSGDKKKRNDELNIMCKKWRYFVRNKNVRGQSAEMMWRKYCREIRCTGHSKV
jgi:hypothetical protein